MDQLSFDDLEDWKAIPGYEGLYLVSNHGPVRSLPRNTTSGRTLKPIPDKRGYLYVTLTKDGRQKRYQVHQLVMLAYAGEPKPGQEVRHLDGNPANNRWAPGETDDEVIANGGNLVYGTHAKNMQDKKGHGREWQSNVTHCPANHEYTPENTRILKSGSRACKECAREKGREWWRAHADRSPSAACLNCGEAFDRPIGDGHRKYCSQECAREAHRTQNRERMRAQQKRTVP